MSEDLILISLNKEKEQVIGFSTNSSETKKIVPCKLAITFDSGVRFVHSLYRWKGI
jgi:hypothetical protein